MSTHRRLARTVVLGWALLYARHGTDWRPIDQGPYDPHCGRLLASKVEAETLDSIGGALAMQAADNPLRREAFERARRRVADRYRCVFGVR